ncbi:hypothetical protein T4D_5158 [Trichinella pseudospiralis]|uniref:Uncharacterized protein n=1 Tax=Trichinella pseudospiralis TaxID=6337 RepID=A0A0V1DNB7_TRIPS|nr:hypothetical protein T4D_5158 [Trichinella pseudospiralis]
MQLYDSILDNKLHSVPRVLDKSLITALLSFKFYCNQFSREYSERRVIFQERRKVQYP